MLARCPHRAGNADAGSVTRPTTGMIGRRAGPGCALPMCAKSSWAQIFFAERLLLGLRRLNAAFFGAARRAVFTGICKSDGQLVDAAASRVESGKLPLLQRPEQNGVKPPYSKNRLPSVSTLRAELSVWPAAKETRPTRELIGRRAGPARPTLDHGSCAKSWMSSWPASRCESRGKFIHRLHRWHRFISAERWESPPASPYGAAGAAGVMRTCSQPVWPTSAGAPDAGMRVTPEICAPSTAHKAKAERGN